MKLQDKLAILAVILLLIGVIGLIYMVHPMLVPIVVLYLAVTGISHYEGMMFGSAIPDWLCIYCLIEKMCGK